LAQCTKIQRIIISNLRHISVSVCHELEEVPSMETLVSLEELWSGECVKMRSMQGFLEGSWDLSVRFHSSSSHFHSN